MCFVKPDKKNLVLGRVKPDEFYLWPTYIRKKLRGMDQPTLEENLEDKCKTWLKIQVKDRLMLSKNFEERTSLP
jgi:hypothetical protein